MTIFALWMGVTLLLLSLYAFVLWRRGRSRFRARLTFLFLLFVLTPTIPLAFLTASLLTRSADLLLIPGVETALDTSLETIKHQAEAPGRLFLQRTSEPATWTEEVLKANSIGWAGFYRKIGGRLHPESVISNRNSGLPPDWRPGRQDIENAFRTVRTSSLSQVEESGVLTLYQLGPDSSLAVVAYTVDPLVMTARSQIDRAYTIYSTLSLIKESIIQKNVIWGLAVLFVIVWIVLALFAAGKLSRSVSEPIQSLTRGMKQATEGDLTARVTTRSRDEFRFLTQTFNQMVKDLDTSQKKLIRAERLAAWQDVARRISHEIKNSLTPVSLSLRRVRNHVLNSDMGKPVSESLTAIEEEMASLGKMAAAFSEFARMPEPKKEDIDLNTIVRNVAHLVRATAGPVDIRTQLDSNLPSISADRDQIKRLITNLVKNGVEAMSGRGVVTITTRPAESGGGVELEVSDTGEGMDQDTLSRIGTPYFTTKRNGTGLGLAIVYKIVEDHDANIDIHSQAKHGTHISIRFPQPGENPDLENQTTQSA